jgi:hypothetical protein
MSFGSLGMTSVHLRELRPQDGMGRMGRMRKILLAALGSLPQRLKKRGEQLSRRVASRAAVPHSLGRLGGELHAEAIILYILSIPSKQFPQSPFRASQMTFQ